MTIHKAYVEHLLTGYQPVKFGGQMITFNSQSGSGWWRDKAKSLWNGAKSLFSKHVQPVITTTVNKHLPVLLDAGKKSLNEAFRNVANSQGSVRDRLNAGLSSVKQDIQTGKFNSSDILRAQEKANQPVSYGSMMTPATYGSMMGDNIAEQHQAVIDSGVPITGQSGYGLKTTRPVGRPRKVK